MLTAWLEFSWCVVVIHPSRALNWPRIPPLGPLATITNASVATPPPWLLLEGFCPPLPPAPVAAPDPSLADQEEPPPPEVVAVSPPPHAASATPKTKTPSVLLFMNRV